MESGNSNGLNTDAPKTDQVDWRNYRSPSSNTSNNSTTIAKEPRKRDGNGTAIGLAVFGLIIGVAGCIVGGFALYKTFQQPTVISTASADGYYTGNSAELESNSIASIATKVTPAVVSIVSEGYSSSYYGIGGVTQSAGTGMIVSADGVLWCSGGGLPQSSGGA